MPQVDPAQRYLSLTAEEIFHSAVWNLLNKRTPEIVKEHEDCVAAAAAQRWGNQRWAVLNASKVSARLVSDESYWYRFFRQKFLMIDEFPKSKERFKLSFEDYRAARASMPIEHEPSAMRVSLAVCMTLR